MSEITIIDVERNQSVGVVSESGYEATDELFEDAMEELLYEDDIVLAMQPGKEPGDIHELELSPEILVGS